MKYFLPILFLSLAVGAPARGARVETGIDVLERTGLRGLKGKRIGLITNPTGRDRKGRSTAEILAAAPGVELAVLFAPEHGITGDSEADRISSGTIRLGGRDVPVVSLYAGGIEGMRPRQEDLKGLDALVFDIQDVGTRCYTYLATMGMALEESAKAGIGFVVLDRPNPVGGLVVEGPVLDDLSLRRVTSTAYYPVPIRHGMTAGEIALLHNAEVKSPRLSIVKLRGWSRRLWFDETGLPWTPPSPNMPDLEAAALYPGISLFEASNVAVGRGTPIPFRWIGAPWMDGAALAALMNAAGLPGVRFSAQDYTPAKSVFAGRPCHGVRLSVVDRDALRPVAVARELLLALRRLHPKEFEWRWDEAKRMIGTDRFRVLYEGGADPEKMKALFDGDLAGFLKARRPYLLY